MKKYIIIGLLTILFGALFSCVYAASVDDVKQKIIAQAKELGVEPSIVLSIARVESGFNQSARGAGGHIGVFQLSKATAKTMGYNPHRLDDNIKCGVLYYKKLYDRFGTNELAVAAYNLGPEAISRNKNKVPQRCKKFVAMVMNYYNIYKKAGL